MGSNCVCGNKQTICATTFLTIKKENIVHSNSNTLDISLNPNKSPRPLHLKNKQKAPVIDGRKKFNKFREAKNATMSDRAKSDRDKTLIRKALNSHFILKNFDEESQNLIIDHMILYILETGEIIFEQGKPGLCFYVLSSGRVELIIDGQTKAIFKSGMSFGELALIDDRPRSGTIKTLERCTL